MWRSIFIGLYRVALLLGARPRNAARILGHIRFQDTKATWQKAGGEITKQYKITTDFSDNAGSARRHYFHQDLLVAKFIHDAAPQRHIDIGSRIDGFVAHVAAFREIEVMDIRPLDHLPHKNIKFLQHDLMQAQNASALADSVSCLHAIEHFGLGRYGDPIDVNGHLRGFENVVKLLVPKGRLYISFPITACDEVHFNAHRVFAPDSIFSWPSAEKLMLKRFDWVDDRGDLHEEAQIDKLPPNIHFGCGIYSFEKNYTGHRKTRHILSKNRLGVLDRQKYLNL